MFVPVIFAAFTIVILLAFAIDILTGSENAAHGIFSGHGTGVVVVSVLWVFWPNWGRWSLD